MLGSADLHNFGKFVSQTTEGGISYFDKPRPVFWEWLFFGADSPLRSALTKTSKTELSPLSEIFFGLNATYDPVTKCGRVQEVPRDNADAHGKSAESLINYGALIAYTYVFGILDLHNENVILSAGKPQVIDAEIVLSNILIPDETLLLPFKDVPFKDSALSLMFESLEGIQDADIKLILIGFTQAIFGIENALPEIRTVFLHLQDVMANVPIRVILRNTKKYYDHLSSRKESILMPEELEQLNRNEIPYFFKFIGRDELFFYTSPDGDKCQVDVPVAFKVAVSRIGRPYAELLDEQRLRRSLFGPGVLLLLRKLLPKSWNGSFEFCDMQVEANAETMLIRSPWGSFGATRARSSFSSTT